MVLYIYEPYPNALLGFDYVPIIYYLLIIAIPDSELLNIQCNKC